MRVIKVLKNRLAWSLRRLSLDIPKNALVLEVGSGGNPYPRSNVLVDAYESTQERHWEPLVCDRPTVLSYGENLPFKDKAFDYVIAAHVLEHSPYPEKFLLELSRVGKAGYIETPDAFMERINPYKDHRLEVTLDKEVLVVRKKQWWLNDLDLVSLYEKKAKKIIANETIPQNPSAFHVRYFWRDSINFTVVNPSVDSTWEPPACDYSPPQTLRKKIRLIILSIIRWIFSQNARNSRLDILGLLRCPKCFSERLDSSNSNSVICKDCDSSYRFDNNFFKF